MTFPRTEPPQADGVTPNTATTATNQPSPSQQAPAPMPSSVEPASEDLAGQLARLVELHRAGGLTVEEFSMAKSRVLRRPVSKLPAPRIVLRMPSRRLVPEIHPVGAAQSVSLAVLDQVARRLGGTCRPVSEAEATQPLNETSHVTIEGVHVAVDDGQLTDGAPH